MYFGFVFTTYKHVGREKDLIFTTLNFKHGLVWSNLCLHGVQIFFFFLSLVSHVEFTKHYSDTDSIPKFLQFFLFLVLF